MKILGHTRPRHFLVEATSDELAAIVGHHSETKLRQAGGVLEVGAEINVQAFADAARLVRDGAPTWTYARNELHRLAERYDAIGKALRPPAPPDDDPEAGG